MSRMPWVALCLLALEACDKNEATLSTASASASAATPPAMTLPVVVAAPPAIDVATLPVEEEFEAEAEKELSAKNLSAKLDELAKEINEP